MHPGSKQSTIVPELFNPIALIMAKTPLSFGHSECNGDNMEKVKANSKATYNLPPIQAMWHDKALGATLMYKDVNLAI